MKKVILILVAGLMMSGNAFAETINYNNGDKYVGEWKDNKKHGQGTYYFSNGSKYVGEYKANKRSGRGTGFYADGSKDEGVWENDKFVGKSIEPVKEKKKTKIAKSSGKK